MNLDTLELQIVDNAAAASSHLDSIAASLNSLKTATSGSAGLNKVSKALAGLSTSLSSMQSINLPTAKIQELTGALQPLTTLGKSSFNSLASGLSKVGDISKTLETVDMNKFATQIQRVAAAMRPLADEAAKVYVGLKWLPGIVNKVIGANGKLATSNHFASKSYNAFGISISSVTAKFGIMVLLARRMGDMVGGWISKANEYVENLNLFNVSMGKYAQEALDYAQKINASMGVDMSEWIRNQGIIMDMSKSFGVAEGTAYKMSKALTQLAYDYSSLYNIKVVDSMQKVQSAIAGEIEPVRRLGKDISVAKLQTELLALGFTDAFNNLTQGDKSMLRTISLLKQSTSAMGDYARTIESPANQMRIFSARVGEMVRALGNAFIPIISAVLPYITAFVQLLTMAANAISSFLGFKLPKFDYSGIDKVGSSAGEVKENISGAEKEAKKLSKTLLSLDELNIAQKDEEKSGGAGGGAGYGGGLSDSLAKELEKLTNIYDEKFANAIKTKTEEIVRKIKTAFMDLKKAIEPFIPIAKGIGAALATAFALGWIAKAVVKFKSLLKTVGLLSPMASIFNMAATSFKLGVGPLNKLSLAAKSLWTNFNGFMKGLSPFSKFSVAVAGVALVFTTTYEAIKRLANGSMEWYESLLNISAAIIPVGVALTVMLGPIGLIITGFAALSGAILGNASAVKELNSSMFENNLMNGTGIPIENVVKSVSSFNDSVLISTKSILENSSAFEQNNKNVNDAGSKILSLSGFMSQVSGDIASNYVPEIKAAFDDMYNSINNNMQLTQISLIGALSTAPQEILDKLNVNIPAITDKILESTGAIINDSEELRERFGKVFSLWENDKSNKKLQDELSDLSTKMFGLSNDGVIAIDSFNLKMSDIGNVNLGSVENVENAILGITDSASTTIDKLQETKDATQSMIDSLSAALSNEEQASLTKLYDELFTLQQQDVLKKQEEAIATIKSSYEQVAKQSSEQAIPNILEYAQGLTSWFFGGLQPEEGAKQIASDNFYRSIMSTFDKTVSDIQGPLKEKAKTLGVDFTSGLSIGVSDSGAYQGVKSSLDNLSEKSVNDFHNGAWKLGSPSKTMIQFAKWIVEGIPIGIQEKTVVATQAIQTLSQKMSETFKSDNKINGNSSLYATYGQSLVLGISQGINDMANTALSSLQSIFSNMLSSLSSFVSNATQQFNNVLNQVKDIKSQMGSLNNIKISSSKYGISVKGYATGGSPVSGELFMARENGIPEMVGAIGSRTTVANNDQIVSGITGGVSKANEQVVAAIYAMANAMVNAITNNGTTVSLDGKIITETVVRNINSQTRQTGNSPILI